MDKHVRQSDEPRNVDLTQVEREAGPRADPLFERQRHEAGFAGRRLQARFRSDTPARSPAGTATAIMKLVLAATVPAAGVVAAGKAVGATGGQILALALFVFVLVGGVGLFLILRIERGTREQRGISSGEGEGSATDLRGADEAGAGPDGHQAEQPSDPTRSRRSAPRK
jgi:hypothetical protein